MSNKVQRRIFYSNFQLTKAYRYRKLFQFYPIDPDVDHKITGNGEYPILLEYRIDKDEFYQSQFAKDRYADLKRQVKNNHGGALDKDSEDWLEQHELSTSMRIADSISMEIIYLLNFFLNKTISYYPNRRYWVSNKISKNADGKLEIEEFKPAWSSVGYNPIQQIERTDYFHNYHEYYQQNDFVDFKDYYSELRNCVDMRKEKPLIYELPDTLSIFLETYFNLNKVDKKKVYFALRNFFHAEKIKSEIKSYGFFALVTAIESVGDFSHDNITEDFTNFMINWSSGKTEEDRQYYRKLYKFRCDVAHGKFLRQDMPDSGFIADSNDFEPDVRFSSGFFQNVLLNWFIGTHVRPKMLKEAGS